MTGYIKKYFENGGKNMSFVIKDDDVLKKHNEIWGKIKGQLNIIKNYTQVYLEECKYKMKKTKMTKFIESELKSELESELEPGIELELKSDTEQL